MKTHAIVIAPLFLATFVTAGCKPEADPPEPVRPVLSTVVQPTPADSATIVGTIEPRFKTELGFRVLGRLIGRTVNVGDTIDRGQQIAVIDSTALEMGVRSARAELAKAEAQLANTSAAEQRQRTLVVTGATAKATVDSAEQARAGAESLVAHAKANLTKAVEQLGYAQLHAEFAGIVTAVGAEVGQVVVPGQSVVTVARSDVREAVVDIGDDFPVPLKAGLPFTVSLQLFPAVQAVGEIREIAPQADPVTRTHRVRIALQDPPAGFRLGATVAATLSKGQSAVLRVPASAVLTRDGESFVWAVDLPASTVSLQKVALTPEGGGFRVTGGIVPGARVVTAGVHSLNPGQHVRIEQDGTP